VLLVRALFENWVEQRKNDKANGCGPGEGSDGLFLLHAVIVLARAKKSRLVDHAFMVVYEGERKPLEVPDVALDRHTRRGREMGRGLDHFFEEGAKL
jgi:hypothetical protein